MGYEINELFYEDEDYPNKANWCNESGKYGIVEAEPDDQGNRRFKIIEIVRTEQELLQEELSTLLSWFDEYDNQVKQYSRCQRLGIAYDKDIEALDNQAKTNAERISEIRKILEEN